ELRQGTAVDGDELLLEGDPLVPPQEGSAETDLTVTPTQFGGHMCDLEAARFALTYGSAEQGERFEEERADEVGLELAGFGPLHLVTNALDVVGGHEVADERPLVDDLAQRLTDSGVDHSLEPRPYQRLIAVTNRFDQEIAKGL